MSTFDDRTEAALIEAAKRGDADAYADLVRMYQALAFRVAWTMLGQSDDAHDVAQDAFIKAWRRLDRFRTGASFRPWLLTIVANEARNRIRGQGRRRRREFAVAVPDLADDDPVADVIAGERRRRIHEAVSSLDPRERSAIVCRYFLDLSEAETSDVLEIPAGTVKSRLNRARRALADSLVADGEPL